MKEVSLPAAAARLGVAWHTANALMLSGQLGPARQKENGRWMLTEEGVSAYIERRKLATHSA